MNSRYVFPVLRTIVLIVAAGLILINARAYLFEWFSWSIAPNVYGIVGIALFLIVVSTSTKPLVGMLKVDALERQARMAVSHSPSRGNNYVGQIHRYPISAIALTLIAVLILVSLPYLSAWPDKAIAPITYFICFGVACGATAALIYFLRYRVTIESDRMVIRAFKTLDVRFDDIVRIDAAKPITVPPTSPRCLVLLNDGTEVKLSGLLTGFADLVDVLTAKASKPIGSEGSA
jgi:hypothetical protein